MNPHPAAVDAAIAAGIPSADNVPDLSRLKEPSLAEKEKLFANVLGELGLIPQCICGQPITEGIEAFAIIENRVNGEAGMQVHRTQFCSRECSVFLEQLPILKRTATKLVLRALPAVEWIKGGARIPE